MNESNSHAPLAAPEPGRGKRTAAVILILAAIFAALCILVGGIVSTLRAQNENPAWRTLRAVLPGGEVLDCLLTVGGDITLEGTVGQAVLPTVPADKPFGFSTQLQYNREGELFMGSALYSGDELIGDAALLVGADGLELYSETLLGECLSLPFEGMSARLEQSVLAPTGGSAYALDEATFDALMELARACDPAVTATDDATARTEELRTLLTDAFTKITEAAGEHLTVTEERRRVSLLDRTTKADVYTVTFTDAYLSALLEAAATEWRENEQLSALLKDTIRQSLATQSLSDAEADRAVEDAYEALSETVLNAMEELQERLGQSPLTCIAEAAIKSNYLVSLTVTITVGESVESDTADKSEIAIETNTDTDTAEHPATGVTFSLLFTSDPDDDPAFELTYATYKDDLQTAGFRAEQAETAESGCTVRTLTVHEDTFNTSGRLDETATTQLIFEHRNSGAYTFEWIESATEHDYDADSTTEELFRLTAEGSCYAGSRYLDITLKRLEILDRTASDGDEAADDMISDSFVDSLVGDMAATTTETESTDGDETEVVDGRHLVYAEEDLYLNLMIEAGDPTMVSLDTGDAATTSDPLTWSESELDDRLVQFEAAYTEFRQDVNESLGMMVFQPDYTADFTASHTLDGTVTHMAFDAETERLFIVHTGNGQTTLDAYDIHTMQPVGSIPLADAVIALDADGGRVVLAYVPDKSNPARDRAVWLFDAATCTASGSITVLEYDPLEIEYGITGSIGTLAVDGDRLYAAETDQWCKIVCYDLSTGQSLPLSFDTTLTIYQPQFTLDREHHVLCLTEVGISTTTMRALDSLTGELLGEVSYRDYNDTAAYADGTHFGSNGTFMGLDGQAVTDPLAGIRETTTATIGAILRMDDRIHAYLTVDIDTDGATVRTEIYSAHGDGILITDDTITSLIPLSDMRYLATVTDGTTASLVVMELTEVWDILPD